MLLSQSEQFGKILAFLKQLDQLNYPAAPFEKPQRTCAEERVLNPVSRVHNVVSTIHQVLEKLSSSSTPASTFYFK